MTPECYRSTFTGRTITKGWSDHHYYEFVHHTNFGLCFFLDGVIQSAEADQHIYHEKLVRAALEEQPSPRDVLIIGGTGGGAVRQLRNATVGKPCRITIVDIDEKLFAIGRDLMWKWGSRDLSSMDDLETMFLNGSDYLRAADREFDIIILDIGDPLPHTRSNEIYSPEVLSDIGRVLRHGGVVSFHSAAEHALDHIFVTESLETNCTLRKLSQFRATIPSFERSWMFNILKKHSL